MVLSANGVRTAPREREASEREKPQRARSEKRGPLRQANLRMPKPRSRASPASSRRSTPRWRCRIFLPATRSRRRNSPRRDLLPRTRCSAPRKPGWKPACNRMKRRVNTDVQARDYVAARLLLRLGFCRPRLRHGLGPALDRDQAAAGKGVDAGTRAARKRHDGDALAARIIGQADIVGRADAAHDVAFGMSERHRSSGRRRRAGSPLGQCIGIARARRHSRTGSVGADEIVGRDRLLEA